MNIPLKALSFTPYLIEESRLRRTSFSIEIENKASRGSIQLSKLRSYSA